MAPRLPVVLLVATLVTLAGCGDTIGSTSTEATLTPVAVPSDSPTAETTPTAITEPPAATGGRETRTPTASVPEPRYLSLRPTCERPPGLVVAIQVGALRNDPPDSDEGINTTWQFATPETRRTIGSLERFVDVIERGYEPLLTAETVTYGPLTGEDGLVSTSVTVRNGSRTTTYRWVLERQPVGPRAGCWLTAAVFEVEDPARSPDDAPRTSGPSPSRS